MEFNKNHKVKHELLEDKEEARAFIDFLVVERFRHATAVRIAGWGIVAYKASSKTYDKAKVELWHSQVLRHGEDIASIDVSIKEVKERLGL